MKILKYILPLLLLMTFFTACKDDGYSLDYYWVSYATVENPEQRNAFYFTVDDNNERMFTAASNLYSYYRPKDRQRIIVSYTILNDKAEGTSYDHDVRLNDVINILTKGIFDITPSTQDSIGNDIVTLNDMWISQDFLTIKFEYTGLDRIHFINLVYDAEKVYDDNKLHLEFRHNDNNDMPLYKNRGIVSFDLNSLKTQSFLNQTDGLDLAIHVKESENSEEKVYDIRYKFSDNTPGRYKSKEKIDIKQFRAQID